MTRYFCDVCGTDSDSVIRMIFAPTDILIRSAYHEQSWNGDVCEGCRKKILSLIEQEASNHHE